MAHVLFLMNAYSGKQLSPLERFDPFGSSLYDSLHESAAVFNVGLISPTTGARHI